MPLAALIAAQDQTDIGDGLRATLPFAGRTLVEYQARLAIEAGAGHVVILVERVPALLAQAVERLRRQGARVEFARSVSDAVERFHPEERILLVADGVIAAQAAFSALAAQPGAAVLALPDTQDYAQFERIDASQRWAGIAIFGKPVLEATIQMLGDWDLSSTLLRRLVQSDAARVDALNPTGDRPVPSPVLAIGPAAIGHVEASLLRRAEPGSGDWAEIYIHRLVASPMVGPLIARKVDRRHIALASVAIAWSAALFGAFNLFWVAILLLPLAAALASAARRMERVWGGSDPAAFPEMARHGAALAVLILLGRLLAAEGGWGWWLVAAIIPSALVGLAGLEPIVQAIRPLATPRWMASADTLVWSTPMLFVIGGWRWMLAALAVYATMSFLERFRTAWEGARVGDK